MDSPRSSPSQKEPAAKKPYSAPKLTDLGAIEKLSMAGSGAQAEGMGSTNVKRHP
jgi:hypothetical protein